MANGASKHRIAVVSPTIDKRHGTERRVAECVSRLAGEYDIHVYSKHVEDIDLSRITWHRIPDIRGPHLLRYAWWFAANHLWRRWDIRGGRPGYEMVYSPGINCLDADVVSVHIIFSEYRQRVSAELRLLSNPVRSWPRLIHRRLYYQLISAIERRVYPKPALAVGAVSAQVAENLRRYFQRANPIRVVYQGIDPETFNPEARLRRRPEMRRSLGLTEAEFIVLLIGNDWKNKGLPCLLEALARLPDLPVKALVVGSDARAPFAALADKLRLDGRIIFLEPSPDVMQYYAAADTYVGASLHDSFALPPSEAMACGLPVVTSRSNGAAEMITNGVDGLVLEDARDSAELARLLRSLCENPSLHRRLGDSALQTARKYTWERNVDGMRQLFEEAIEKNAAVRALAGSHGVADVAASGNPGVERSAGSSPRGL